MTKTEYLYGQKKDWGDLSYDEALKRKIKLAKIQIDTELEVPMMVRHPTRITEILRAIKHNEILLKE